MPSKSGATVIEYTDILSYFPWLCRLLSLLTHLFVGSMAFSTLPLFIKSQETNQPLIKGDVQLLQVPFGWKGTPVVCTSKYAISWRINALNTWRRWWFPLAFRGGTAPNSNCLLPEFAHNTFTSQDIQHAWQRSGRFRGPIRWLKASLGCSTTNPGIACLWSLKSEKRPQPPQQSSL